MDQGRATAYGLLAVGITVFLVLVSLYQGSVSDPYIVRLRAVRVAAAMGVGASLAVAGAMLQAILRNPLASPFTLGVTQAAGFGASYAIVFLGAGLASTAYPVALNPYLVTFSAFLAAMAAAAAVYMLSAVRGLSSYAIILAGIAVGFAFQAATMLVQYLAPAEVLVSMTLFWIFGDVTRVTPSEALIIAMLSIASTMFATFNWLGFNAIAVGDEYASSIGVNVRLLRGVSLLVSAVTVAVPTAFAGVIGFVGLVAPHVVRLAIGSSGPYFYALTALTGALILLAADFLGRVLLHPYAVPVSITTSIIGSAALVALMAWWKPWRSWS